MNTDVESILQMMSESIPDPEQFDVAAFRAQAAGSISSTIDLHSVHDDVIEHDGVKTSIRIYRPSSQPESSALIYFHGGGFILGNLDTHDSVCRELALGTQSIVCAVDYRLAPEHPFPAAINDGYAVLSMFHRNARSLRIDAERIGVAGDSSGATIAAGLALKARDDNGPHIRFQALFLPMLSHRSVTSSRERYGRGGYGITAALLDWYSDQYAPAEAAKHPYCSPLSASDLSGLPPAFIQVAELDPLRDEGVSYADRLRKAGVQVVLREALGLFHGFQFFTESLPSAVEEMSYASSALTHLMRSDM